MLGLGVAVCTSDRSSGKEPCLVHYLSRNLQLGYTLHTPLFAINRSLGINKNFQQSIKYELVPALLFSLPCQSISVKTHLPA